MKQFCNKELRDNRHLTDEKSDEYRKRFLHCIDLVKVVFSTGLWVRSRMYGSGIDGARLLKLIEHFSLSLCVTELLFNACTVLTSNF